MFKSIPYLQTGIHYGAYYGLTSFCFSIILFYIIGNPFGPASWLGVWIPIVFIVTAIKKHQQNIGKGSVSYWESFRAGFFTIVCGGGLYALLIYVSASTFAGNLLDDYKGMMLREAEQLRGISFFSENFVNTIVKGIEETTLASLISNDYTNKLFGGAFISLIVAAVYKKEKMPDDNRDN